MRQDNRSRTPLILITTSSIAYLFFMSKFLKNISLPDKKYRSNFFKLLRYNIDDPVTQYLLNFHNHFPFILTLKQIQKGLWNIFKSFFYGLLRF